MNALREKLARGEKVYGTLVCLTDPALCEIMGKVGYDCVWIDMEHTYISPKEMVAHLNASAASGISSVVRLPQNDLTFTKKVLEMGPDGIIFPMTSSVEEIEALVKTTLYPPLGTRGFGPMRAIGYGALDPKEYAKKESLELCRFAQIEHKALIENVHRLAELPYVDGYIFGPNDLSGSFGEFLNVFGEKTFSQIRYATEVLREKGKIVGLAGGLRESDIQAWSTLDLNMLFSGGDWNFLYTQGKATLDVMKKHF